MAEDQEIELAEPPRKRSKLKIVVFALLGGVMVSAGAVLATLYATGMLSSGGDGSDDVSTIEAEPEPAEAVYVSLDPAFTVNFSQAGSARFLQLTLEAMTRDPEVEAALKQHMPVIRNDLMLLFSSRQPEQLRTRAGKEALQADTLASVQGILQRETGAPGVEAIYFTSFVMQ